MRVIGFLNGQSPGPFAHLLAGFHRGLNQTGFVDAATSRSSIAGRRGPTDRMVAMAAELVRRGVAVIVATGGAHHVLSRLGRQGSPRFRTIQVCPKDLPPALP
jgi:putative tryptophan/tyrosine transport system substrate-binding protein